jgi:hypothetical protein
MKGQIEQDRAAELITLEVEELENRTAPNYPSESITFSYGSFKYSY